MIDNIIIIDNVIPKIKQIKIEELLSGPNTPWIYNADVTYNKAELRTRNITNTTPGINCLFQDVTKKFETPHFQEIKCIAEEATEKINFKIKMIVQSRSFLQFPLNNAFQKKHDTPHIDLGMDHLVCLYYVNDTDGDTFIFDKKRGDDKPLDNLQVVKQVTPKQGRCLLFNGNHYHASSGPTLDIRCIINFDII